MIRCASLKTMPPHLFCARVVFAIFLFASLASSNNLSPQELEPRAYSPALVGLNFLVTTYTYSSGNVLLARFLVEGSISVIPFGEAHYGSAVEARLRYGKGRHRASLNFGDCMAYATAKLAGQPLLCTGADFGRTDLELA